MFVKKKKNRLVNSICFFLLPKCSTLSKVIYPSLIISWSQSVRCSLKFDSKCKRLMTWSIHPGHWMLAYTIHFPKQALVFTHLQYRSWKLWEKEKLLVTSNFFLFHSVFNLSGELNAIFIKFETVICRLFQFGRVQNLSLEHSTSCQKEPNQFMAPKVKISYYKYLKSARTHDLKTTRTLQRQTIYRSRQTLTCELSFMANFCHFPQT